MGKKRIAILAGLCCALPTSIVGAQTPYAQPQPAQPYAQPAQPYAQQPTQVYVQPQPQPVYVQTQAQPVGPCPAPERGPAILPYRPGPPPNGYVLEDNSTPGLWITGAALLGGAYIISVFAARPSLNDGTEALYAPVFGPWITLGQCPTCDDAAHSGLVLDGLTQLAGATMIVLGIVIRDKKYVRAYDDLAWSVTPRRFGADGYGVGLFGRF